MYYKTNTGKRVLVDGMSTAMAMHTYNQLKAKGLGVNIKAEGTRNSYIDAINKMLQ
jgi:hypothetical protein